MMFSKFKRFISRLCGPLERRFNRVNEPIVGIYPANAEERGRIYLLIRYDLCVHWTSPSECAYMNLLARWWIDPESEKLTPYDISQILNFIRLRIAREKKPSKYLSMIWNELHVELLKIKIPTHPKEREDKEDEQSLL